MMLAAQNILEKVLIWFPFPEGEPTSEHND